jgi:hypothetical protein
MSTWATPSIVEILGVSTVSAYSLTVEIGRVFEATE